MVLNILMTQDTRKHTLQKPKAVQQPIGAFRSEVQMLGQKKAFSSESFST